MFNKHKAIGKLIIIIIIIIIIILRIPLLCVT